MAPNTYDSVENSVDNMKRVMTTGSGSAGTPVLGDAAQSGTGVHYLSEHNGSRRQGASKEWKTIVQAYALAAPRVCYIFDAKRRMR